MSDPSNPGMPNDRADWSFAALIDWHLTRGTRPKGDLETPGDRWTNKKFGPQVGVDERTVRNWRKGRSVPPDTHAIERALFGTNTIYAAWRAALREAQGVARSSKGDDVRGRGSQRQSSPIHNLPYPSLCGLFKGRGEFIEKLHTVLTRDVNARTAIVSKAIYGLGGIGKTRAVVEYAWAHSKDYRAHLFVVAESPERLHENLAQLAGPMVLDLPVQNVPEVEVRLKAVLVWLNAHPGWLLILDNVDTPEALAESERLLANVTGGCVVMTSRLSNFSAQIERLELGVLTIDDSTAFLLERTAQYRAKSAKDDAEAKGLAEDLGQLALALEQAGAYIGKHEISFERYRTLWRDNWAKVAGWGDEAITKYPRELAVTWQTSVEQLTEPAKRLLARLSWLAPEPIPDFLLDIPVPDTDAEDLHDALADLKSYSLVTRSLEDATFSIHRLVQEATRHSLPEITRQQSRNEALKWVDTGFSGDPADYHSWEHLDPLASHVLRIVGYADAVEVGERLADLMDRLGQMKRAKGLYLEADPLLKRALEIRECVHGADHLTTAASYNNVASNLDDQGRYEEAEPLYKNALEIREPMLGVDHPVTATSYNNVAYNLNAQGRYEEAEPLFKKALDIRERVLGTDHPATATSYNNMAYNLDPQRRYQEAEPLYKKALEIWERVLGVDHPSAAASTNNLAYNLNAQGRYEEAEPLMKQALEINERVLGIDHPLTAASYNNVAYSLIARGLHEEAEQLYKKALEISERTLGVDHPQTKAIRKSLENIGRKT